jgi:hypothetical protein
VGARRTVLTKWDVMVGLPTPAAPARRGRATRWPRQAGELCGDEPGAVLSRNTTGVLARRNMEEEADCCLLRL